MKKSKIVLFVAALLTTVFVASASGSHGQSLATYWSGNTTGNHWRLTPHFNYRYAQRVDLDRCLPDHAQIQIANFLDNPDGGLIMYDQRRSDFGHCGTFAYPLDSWPSRAKAGCRIIEQGPGGTVTRHLTCITGWSHEVP